MSVSVVMLKGLGLSKLLVVTDMSVHTLAPIHPHTYTKTKSKKKSSHKAQHRTHE